MTRSRTVKVEDVQRVKTLANVFSCSICAGKLKDAHLCRHCSQLYCYKCIEHWLIDQNQKQCRQCHKELCLNELIKCHWAEEVTRQLNTLEEVFDTAITEVDSEHIRIKDCKDNYEVPENATNAKDETEDATECEIRGAYKKLDPAKKKASGSAEAFKTIENAFDALTIEEKRKQYDPSWSEEKQPTNSERSHYESTPRSEGSRKSETETEAQVYTKEQIECVERINGCKDLYDILGVTKEATELEIKEAYEKLAPLLDPDKNKAPDSAKALGAVEKAFTILTNEKRKPYDCYGSEQEQSRNFQSHQESNQGFEGSEKTETKAKAPEYTKEQMEIVNRINGYKNLYTILGVTKEATELKIKEVYEKLAPQLDPDKNKAPGSAKALGAVEKAFAILTNEEKRKQYDPSWSPPKQPKSFQSSHQESTRGFEGPKKTETQSDAPEYTQEQVEYVRRIRICSDYYEILGVTIQATEAEIKESYRKLILRLHPDKNKAPGSDEAFKAVDKAFKTLSDALSRKQYDNLRKFQQKTSRNFQSSQQESTQRNEESKPKQTGNAQSQNYNNTRGHEESKPKQTGNSQGYSYDNSRGYEESKPKQSGNFQSEDYNYTGGFGGSTQYQPGSSFGFGSTGGYGGFAQNQPGNFYNYSSNFGCTGGYGGGLFSPRQSRNAYSNDYDYSGGYGDSRVCNQRVTKKHCEFVSNPDGQKPVTSLPGIGKVLGQRLSSRGYGEVDDIREQFMSRDKRSFQNWMKKTCGANSKQARDCYQCFEDLYD